MTDTGWLSPSTSSNVAIDSKTDWTDPSQAESQNDDHAYASSIPSDDYSDYLRCTNFSASIPSGATIDGVEVEMDKYGTVVFSGDNYDKHLYLVYDGSIISGCDDKADTTTAWAKSDSDTYVSYGGASDLWNCSLTESIVEHSTFGVQLSAQTTGNVSGTPRVDHIRIKIYYSEVSGNIDTVLGVSWDNVDVINNITDTNVDEVMGVDSGE